MKVAAVVVSGLAAVYAFGGTGCSIPGELIFAIEDHWGNWSHCPNGPASCTGAVPQVVNHVCEHLDQHYNVNCRRVVVPWPDVWNGATNQPGPGWAAGDFDIAAGARVTGPRLAAGMIFSRPYTVAGDAYIYKAEGSMLSGGITACAMSGSAVGANQIRAIVGGTGPFSNVMSDLGVTSMTIDDHFTSEDDMFNAVVSGACGIAVVANPTPHTGLQVARRIPVATPAASMGVAMMGMPSPAAQCTTDAINDALAEGMADGHIQRVISSLANIDAPA